MSVDLEKKQGREILMHCRVKLFKIVLARFIRFQYRRLVQAAEIRALGYHYVEKHLEGRTTQDHKQLRYRGIYSDKFETQSCYSVPCIHIRPVTLSGVSQHPTTSTNM